MNRDHLHPVQSATDRGCGRSRPSLTSSANNSYIQWTCLLPNVVAVPLAELAGLQPNGAELSGHAVMLEHRLRQRKAEVKKLDALPAPGVGWLCDGTLPAPELARCPTVAGQDASKRPGGFGTGHAGRRYGMGQIG